MAEQQDQAGGKVSQNDAPLSPEAMIEEKRKAVGSVASFLASAVTGQAQGYS